MLRRIQRSPGFITLGSYATNQKCSDKQNCDKRDI